MQRAPGGRCSHRDTIPSLVVFDPCATRSLKLSLARRSLNWQMARRAGRAQRFGSADIGAITTGRRSIDDIHYRTTPAPVTNSRHTLR